MHGLVDYKTANVSHLTKCGVYLFYFSKKKSNSVFNGLLLRCNTNFVRVARPDNILGNRAKSREVVGGTHPLKCSRSFTAEIPSDDRIPMMNTTGRRNYFASERAQPQRPSSSSSDEYIIND